MRGFDPLYPLRIYCYFLQKQLFIYIVIIYSWRLKIKIQLLSDTHTYNYTLNPEVDIIIHCGDISNGDFKFIDEFINKCGDIPYLYIPGNHCFYNKSIEDLYNYLEHNNVNYLKEGKEFNFNGYTFIGGTFFTDFTLYTNNDPLLIDKNKFNAKYCINDFKSINYQNRLITPEDYITFHNIQWNWIQQYRNKENVIVCTHFPPSYKSVTDYWKENGVGLNPYFVTDKNLKGLKYWFHGHVHNYFDYIQDDCRVICNPFGYKNEQEINGFISDLIIEV